MKTRIYTANTLDNPVVQQDIKTTFQEGKNVVFPTETVYGIGASALSKEGLDNIYKIKGRPSDNPLIMHLSTTTSLEQYVYIDHSYVSKLMDDFWPGPLTLVFRKKALVSDFFTGGLQTVGVRVPGSEIARKIIDIAGVPVCAPSANISGRPSSTLFEHVIEDFDGKVDILIDGGKSEVGLESTVLDVTKEVPVILRPGMVTYEMIKEITGSVILQEQIKQDEVPKSPGMKYKHYAPKGMMTIVEGEPSDVIQYINNVTKDNKMNNKTVGVITTAELSNQFYADHVYALGTAQDEMEIASNVFAALREMDSYKIDVIFCQAFTEGAYSEAIMNRLLKAANNNIIKL